MKSSANKRSIIRAPILRRRVFITNPLLQSAEREKKNAGNTTQAADLQKKLDSATSLRSTLQSGETLSGLLLTVYGFSVIANIAMIATNVLYGLESVLYALASTERSPNWWVAGARGASCHRIIR